MTTNEQRPPKDLEIEYDGEAPSKRRAPKTARDKIKDLLASRPHSTQELQEKLGRLYPSDQVEDAISLARERRWLSSDEEVAELTASTLSRKRKGHAFINEQLASKGLPPVAKNADEEIEKARAVIAAKLPKLTAIDYEIEMKIYRLLGNRGFDEETIQAAIDGVKKSLRT